MWSQYVNIFSGFNDKSSIEQDFQLEAGTLDNIFVICALYNYGDYDGDAHVLYVENHKLYEVHGSHCSCYGLEDQWSPEETFPEAAIKQTHFECVVPFLEKLVNNTLSLKEITMAWTDEDDAKLVALLARKKEAEDYKVAKTEEFRTVLKDIVSSMVPVSVADISMANAIVDALVLEMDVLKKVLNQE